MLGEKRGEKDNHVHNSSECQGKIDVLTVTLGILLA